MSAVVFSAVAAGLSFIVSVATFIRTEYKFSKAENEKHLSEVRNGIISVHKCAVNAIIYSGEVSIEHCQKAISDWQDVRALCNEKWALGSPISDRYLKPNLINFQKLCVDDDLVDVDRDSELGKQRMLDMEKARKNLIEAFEGASKMLKPHKK